MAEIRARTNKKPKSVHEGAVETRYTKCIDESGWLAIDVEGMSKKPYPVVPEFVKVVLMKKRGKDGKPTKENETRTFFIIQEGLHKGKTASLTKENAKKCLIKAKRGTGAHIVAKIIGRKREYSQLKNYEYNQLWATLSFDGKKVKITLDSLDSENPPYLKYKETNKTSPYYKQLRKAVPLPKGTYKIITPSAPHLGDNTDFYRTDPGGYPGLRYDRVWFQIENPATYNSNYVHVGNLSEGCVTMYTLPMWNVLYKYLISNRMDKEAKYVGTVTIE